MTSPTARTLAHCRRNGWTAQVVGRYIPQARRRVDLFGAIDVLVLDGKPGSLGIQACAGGDAATRMAKARALPEIAAWLAAGNRFEVWAWRKVGPRGARKLWEVRVVELTLDQVVDPVRAIDDLARIAGPAFAGVDVQEYMDEIRERGD